MFTCWHYFWACLATANQLLTIAGTASAQSLDVYSSMEADGQWRWSTQALNDSYQKVPGLSIRESRGENTTTRFNDSSTVALKFDKVLLQRRHYWQDLIEKSAKRHHVDPNLVIALVENESAFNLSAISPKGARGLMQIMPTTAMGYGMKDTRELLDPAHNLDIGTRHLKDLINAHSGNQVLALAAYNAGAGAVSRHKQRIPNYRETMLYVPAILALASQFSLPNSNP